MGGRSGSGTTCRPPGSARTRCSASWPPIPATSRRISSSCRPGKAYIRRADRLRLISCFTACHKPFNDQKQNIHWFLGTFYQRSSYFKKGFSIHFFLSNDYKYLGNSYFFKFFYSVDLFCIVLFAIFWALSSWNSNLLKCLWYLKLFKNYNIAQPFYWKMLFAVNIWKLKSYLSKNKLARNS